jgi:multidrug efflux pump subunit AcrA (membrane-fusion protein)
VPALAGPGHDHGTPGDSAGGPLSEIHLTEMMIKNLGIATVPAALKDIAKTVDLNATIDYLPEKQAVVSSKADGAVAQILVKSGQKVNKGDAVIVIQPRLVGNPPITLSSPIAGFVTEQNAVIGQSISPDQPLLRIADISDVMVRGQAFEDVAQDGMSVGQSVLVTTSAFPGETFEGTVQRVDAALKPGSRVREIIASIKNPDGKLLANMQATLSVEVGSASTALVVPQRAILGDMGNYFVYVREEDHFYRRDIVLGQKFGPLREIIEGVLPDEQVVTVGNYQLQFVTPPKEGGGEDDHGHDH